MSVFIIAEAGVNHNGDIRVAKALVDMAVRCGADAIKFQTFKAEDCVDKDCDKVGYQKENDQTQETQYEMLKRLELSFEEFKDLKGYCVIKDIVFLSTPFGMDALKFLMSMNMRVIKLSSTEVTNHPYLQKVAEYNKPIILSTGMSYLEEVRAAVEVIRQSGNQQITLLHCTTDYPTKLQDVNMRAMKTMAEELQVEVGYSDHTEDSISAIAAATLGARVIEKHITLDQEMNGPDHKASMMENEFKQYIKNIRSIEILLGDGIKKPTQVEEIMRIAVRRSIVAKYYLKKGTILTEDLLEYKRPATGLSPVEIYKILGKKIIRDINQDEKIQIEDIEDVQI